MCDKTLSMLDEALAAFYGPEAFPGQKLRYKRLAEAFSAAFGSACTGIKPEELFFFSSPGRVEIVGNHTDHNNGCVLAATIDLDLIGAARKNNENRVRIQSEEFSEIDIDLTDLECRAEEIDTPAALVRGVSADLKAKGYGIGGFDAYLSSDLPAGAGISSSASFEVMIGVIYNRLFNGGSIPFDQLAQAGMTAETKYFGKPSGLMDQMAIAAGGVALMDFLDPRFPALERIPFRLDSLGLTICLVDTGDSHSGLTESYASVPDDMLRVANALGKPVMREVTFLELLENFQPARGQCGDQAVLRALHFLDENRRVLLEAEAVKNNDKEEILKHIRESGASSALYLQNIYRNQDPGRQNVMLALYLAERALKEKGAWRVHGGGFGGTTFNLVPADLIDSFTSLMEQAFGQGCCRFLKIRSAGAVCIKEGC